MCIHTTHLIILLLILSYPYKNPRKFPDIWYMHIPVYTTNTIPLQSILQYASVYSSTRIVYYCTLHSCLSFVVSAENNSGGGHDGSSLQDLWVKVNVVPFCTRPLHLLRWFGGHHKIGVVLNIQLLWGREGKREGRERRKRKEEERMEKHSKKRGRESEGQESVYRNVPTSLPSSFLPLPSLSSLPFLSSLQSISYHPIPLLPSYPSPSLISHLSPSPSLPHL